jgi:hypothetical protein
MAFSMASRGAAPKAEGEIMERDVRSAETIPWHRAV